MRIITISREFGSGGRELGKRLADALGIPCYDQQIIELVAQKENLDKTYVANRSEKEMLRKCYEIDKRRAAYRKMFTDKKWGEASGYDLCVNTTDKEIKTLIPSLANYIEVCYTEGGQNEA